LSGKYRIFLAAIVLGGVIGFATFATDAEGRGRVIEFGWDTPTIPWLCENAAITECTIAFHGIVLDLARREDQGGLSWLAWGNTIIAGEVQQRAEDDIALLNDANFTRLRENSFFRLNSSGWSAPPDWFDPDFNTVVSNMAFMASAVNQTALAGIAFDPEDYFSNCWHYPSQKYSATKTFEQYQVQVRQRGREIASVIKSACPGRDFTLLFLFANSLPYISTQWWGHPLHEDSYGLLPAFVDGLLDEAGEQIRLIDGIESAYPNKTVAEFEGSISNYEGGATLSADPSRYLSCVGIGFGTWMDYRSNTFGWYTERNEFHLNHFTPETFNQAMDISTELSEYSWVYTEIPDWYLGTVPEAYSNALADVTGLPPVTPCIELWARLAKAKEPLPAQAAPNVTPNVVLSWEAGIKAASHDVYFGTDYDAVEEANTTETLDVYMGRQDACEYTPVFPLELGQTYYWRIDEVNGPNLWQGDVWSFAVDDGKATYLSPADGSAGNLPDVTLSWSPGVVAASHDIYLGTDFDGVSDANTSSAQFRDNLLIDVNSYLPASGLMLGQTYYWRIDAVNPGYSDSKGDVWSFTVGEYLIVDNMESYSSDSNMSITWKAHPYPDVYNGAYVFLEQTAVQSGVKSMRFVYDVLKGTYFTTRRTYSSPQDWASQGASHLLLWFHGYSDNLADDRMYVVLKDGNGYSEAVTYDGDANDITKEEWQQWIIDVSRFSDGGVELADVREFVIGVDCLFWFGMIFFDDIGLYVPMCVAELGPVADFSGDCIVDVEDYSIFAGQWLQAPGSPSADIAPEPPDGVVDGKDLDVLIGSWLEQQLWP
jgi:hypothetical protein